MKLLLIIDDITLISKLEKDGEIYRYGTIQIKLIKYESPNDFIKIKDILEKERFHLALTATRGQFNGPYIQQDDLANVINNYLATHLRSNIDLFKSELYLVGIKDKYKDIKISCQFSNLYQIDL
jgi:hypothetical protein